MRNYLIKLFLFFIPFLLVFQPYFLEELQYVIIFLRYILIPLFIAFKIKNSSDRKWVLVGFLYFLAIFIFLYNGEEGKPFIIFLNVFSSMCYYTYAYSYIHNINYKLLKYLRYGIDALNLSTISIFILSILGSNKLILFFRDETFLATGYENLFDRFSFGNSIEVPFLITALLYIYIIIYPKKRFFPSVVINLSASFISGSRIIIFISLILFLIEVSKLSLKYRFVLSSFVILLSILYSGIFNIFSESSLLLSTRYIDVSESRSAVERILIFTKFYEQFFIFSLDEFLFGNGFSSSLDFIKYHLGEYRTTETLIVQIFLETGLVGSFIFLSKIISRSFKIFSFSFKGIALFLVLIQLLLFLPVFTFMNLIFLLLGFLHNEYFNKKLSI